MTIQPELLERITVRADVSGGKPITRDMRVVVEHVLGMLTAGDTVETILEHHGDAAHEGTPIVVTRNRLCVRTGAHGSGSGVQYVSSAGPPP